ncbi:endoglucanase [Mollisia scopiformis]|uniref:Endoglucanase EG-II n=1 Tax=Mollisia scopiformis TaxID=149040 RepID=A0A194XWT2_MOLSC|nr:endoglucanase [Mollisia scopiformis]KUJ24202.1 endoglucanase [Mollisia scopiformis]
MAGFKIPIFVSLVLAAGAEAQIAAYGQCGGTPWCFNVDCQPGYTCSFQNAYYSQCVPIALPPGDLAPYGAPGTCTPTPQNCGVTNSPPSCAGQVRFAGINIAGCDFGTDTTGTQTPSGAYCPIGPYNPNGPGQMTHFASENFNIFRLPTGWQYIINSVNPSSTLDPTNFGNYNSLVQACLSTGAYCLIDIHNYARFNGAIVGQGGPSNALFAQLWANIATVYASNSKVVFGIMNEPHDLPSVTTWAATVQAAVTAIRNAGATSQLILLPGNDWTGAGTFVTDGSGPALQSVTNPDGSYTNLIFDVHKYLDSDGSGTGTICVGDQVSTAFAPLAQWLRCNGRQAILSETGGSSDPTCLTYLCSAVSFLNANSDIYLGYIGWAAGSFAVGYNLGETPSYSNGVWTDMPIVTTCLVPK